MECPICKEEIGEEDAICDSCGYVLNKEKLQQQKEETPKPEQPEDDKKHFTSLEEIASLFSDIEEEPETEEEQPPEEKPEEAPPPDDEELQVKAATMAQEVFMEAHEAKGLGADTAKVEQLLENVRAAMTNKRFNVAIGLVEEARAEITIAREERDKYVHAANLAQEALAEIQKLSQKGINTAEAKKFVDLAKAAMRNRDYDAVEDFISSARKSMESAVKSLEVVEVLKQVKAKLVELQSYGIDMTKPEELFRAAREPMEDGDYDLALERAIEAKEYAVHLLLKRQMQTMELVSDSTEGLERAEGVFVLEEDDEDTEVYEAGGDDEEEGQAAYLKLKADFENYRKMTSDKMDEVREFANIDLIASVLDVVDNFERALEAYEKTDSEAEKSITSFMDGMQAIHKQLLDTLKEEGVEPIPAMHEEFDPFMHEAIETVPTDRFAEDTVIEEVQKGYLMKDKVIRPAKVKVSKAVE